MTAKQRKRVRDKAIKDVQKAPLEVILKAAGMCDGWTIFKPEAFAAVGLPDSVVKYTTRHHESDVSDPKSTISGPDGNVLDTVEGIYGLHLIEFMCLALGVPSSSAMGRGFRCQQMQASIKDFCTKAHKAAKALKQHKAGS